MIQNPVRINTILWFLLIVFIIGSCIPQNKLIYLRGDASVPDTSYANLKKHEILIRPHDELYIKVSSFDDVSYNFFSTQVENRYMNFTDELSISLVSYTVNDSGYVLYPILGKVYLQGLSVEEASKKLENSLGEYFSQPIVIIKIVNKKVAILGAVRLPGSYSFTKYRMNIFEALSLAGDITVTGNKKKVYIIREQGDSITRKNVNLTRKDIYSSENFYVQSNDIIYVRPLYSSTWSTIATPINITLSSVTTFLLILRYLEPN